MGDLVEAGVDFVSSFFAPAAQAAETVAPEAGLATLGAAGTGGEALLAGGAGTLSDLAGIGTEAGTAAGTGALGSTLGAAGVDAFGPTNIFSSLPDSPGFGTTAPGTDAGLPGLPGTSPSTAPGTSAIAPTGAAPGTANPTSNWNTPGTTLTPAAPGAASVAAPAGVTPPAGVDATAANPIAPGGQVPGAQGPTSVGGAPVAGGQPSTIDSLLGKATSSITNNPLGVGLGVAGLGYNIYQGTQQTKNEKALTADAQTATANSTNLANQGAALEQYLTNGTLPPAYQTIVNQAIQDAKTTAISNAAAQGLPTDPTKNTALATELAKIDASRATMQTQVASQLFQSGAGLTNAGLQAAGLSGQLYQALVQNDTTQAANVGKAISTLAAALNGKSTNLIGGQTISISPS